MKLAVMQPYFFPYLGYFSLIKHTDQWVVFDTPQFQRHSWIERNRILKPNDGWQYIKIPLIKFKRETAIKDVSINQNQEYNKRILAQLEHYKKKAPFYTDVIEILNAIFTFQTNSIVQLDIKALEMVCNYIGLDFNYTLFSDFSEAIDPTNNPDEWALEISKYLNADEYYNLPGGLEFFNREKYNKSNIKLKFIEVNITEYDQKRDTFIPALSIIDVMMFNSPKEILSMLDNYIIS